MQEPSKDRSVMPEFLSPAAATRALDWAYEQAIHGMGGLPGAAQLGDEYLAAPGRIDERVDRLVRWQVMKSCTSGFMAGLGGFGSLAVTLPANLTSVLYVQLRMVAAIAHMAGHNVESDRVRALAYACLCGNAAKDALKEVGIHVSARLTNEAVARVSPALISRINQRVGFSLVSKFGQNGLINLGRLVPVVGGAVGAAFDGSSTYAVGRIAKQTFVADGAD